MAKADAAPRCIAIPSSANCLMVYPDVLTEATVAANCFVCKSGYYPKGELFVGTCTAMTLKHTCLEFSAGAAANEIDYGKKKCNKCPSEFYYYDGNNGCVRCPYPCKTCLPVK